MFTIIMNLVHQNSALPRANLKTVCRYLNNIICVVQVISPPSF